LGIECRWSLGREFNTEEDNEDYEIEKSQMKNVEDEG
jgi:hypothetical protein